MLGMGTAAVSCSPDGEAVDRGRETLAFACTLDEAIQTDCLSARLRLAGVEEIDVLSGVRLSGALVGSLTGQERFSAHAGWRSVDYHIWYGRTTDFE
jgi:hypothetical protein